MDGDPEQLCHKMQCYFDAEKSNEIDRFPFLVNILSDLTTKISYEITLKDFLQTMDDFITCIQDEALQCSNKPGRAMHLAKSIIDLLFVFKSIARNHFGEVMTHEYFSRCSKILTTYVDMELKASVKARIDHASIANQIAVNIDSHLQASDECQTLDVFINMSRLISIHKDILLKLFQKYLYRPIVLQTRELNDDIFIKYVILFKIWKNIETNATEKRRITDWCVSFVKPKKSLWQNKQLKLLLGKDMKTHSAKQLVAHMCTKISTNELRKYTRVHEPSLGQDNDSDIEEISVDLGATSLPALEEARGAEQLIDICDIKLEKPTVVDSIDLTEEETPKLPLDETRILVKYKWLENLCQRSSEMQAMQFFVPDPLIDVPVIEIVDEEPATADKSVRTVKTYERARTNSGSYTSSILNSNDRANDFVSDEELEKEPLFSSLTDIDTATNHKRITDEIINDWEATSTMDEDEGEGDDTEATPMTAPRTAITVSLPLQFINDRNLLEKSPRKAFRSKGGASSGTDKPPTISNPVEVVQKKSSLKSSNVPKSPSFSLPMKFPDPSCPRQLLVPAVRFSEDTPPMANQSVGQQKKPVDSSKRHNVTHPVATNYQYHPRKLPLYSDLLKKPTILEKKTYINMPRFPHLNNWSGSSGTGPSSHLVRAESHRFESHNKLSGHHKDQAVAQFSSKYNRFIEDSDSDEEPANATPLIYNTKCQALVSPQAIDNKTFKASVQLLDILQVIEKTRKDEGDTSEVNNTLFRRSVRNRTRAYVKFDDIYLDNRLFEPNFKGKLERKRGPVSRRGVKRKSHFEEFGKSLTDVESEYETENVAVKKDNLTDIEDENELAANKRAELNRRRKQRRSIWTYSRRSHRKKHSRKPQEITPAPVVTEQVVDEYPRAFSTRKKVNSFSDSTTLSAVTSPVVEPEAMPTLEPEITEDAPIEKPVKVYKRASRTPVKVSPSPSPQIGRQLDPNITVKILLTKCDAPKAYRNARSLERIAPSCSLVNVNRQFRSAENLAAPLIERRRVSLLDRRIAATVERCLIKRRSRTPVIVQINQEVEVKINRESSPAMVEKPSEPTAQVADDVWDDLVNKPLSTLSRSEHINTTVIENPQPEDHTLMVTALLNAAEGVQPEVPMSQQEPMLQLPNPEVAPVVAPAPKKNRRKNKSLKLDDQQSVTDDSDTSPNSRSEPSPEASLKSRKILQVNKFVKRKAAMNASTDEDAPPTEELVKKRTRKDSFVAENVEAVTSKQPPTLSDVDNRKSKIFLEREMKILDYPAQKVKLKHKLKEPSKIDELKVSSPTVDTTEKVLATLQPKKGNRKRKPTKIIETQVPANAQMPPLPLESPSMDEDQPEECNAEPAKEDEVKSGEENVVDSSTVEVLASPSKLQPDLIKPGNSRKILLVHKFRKTPKNDDIQPAEETMSPLVARATDSQNESESSDGLEPRPPIEASAQSQVDNAEFLECKTDSDPLEPEKTSLDIVPEAPEEVISPKRTKRNQRKRKMFLPKRRRKVSKPSEVAAASEEPDAMQVEEPTSEGANAHQSMDHDQQASETSETSLDFSEISGQVSETNSCDDAEPNRKEVVQIDAIECKSPEFCEVEEIPMIEPKTEESAEESFSSEQKPSEDADGSESETSTIANAGESGSENCTAIEQFQVTEEVSLDSDEIYIEKQEVATVAAEVPSPEASERKFKKKFHKKFARNFSSKLRRNVTVTYGRSGVRVQKRQPETGELSLEKIDSTTNKEEPAAELTADEPTKETTESPLPHTSTDHNINTNIDSMFMDCLSSNQKDIINDSTLAFDMTATPAVSTKQVCEEASDEEKDVDNTHLNEVLNTSHPRSEEEEEIRANKYFDSMSNNLNNTALIDSTISLCNEYENHQKEEDSSLYMNEVDLITTHTSTTDTDEEEAAALNNDTHVETTMNQIYDILTNEKEEPAASSPRENDSSVQITSTCRSTLMEEAAPCSSNTAPKKPPAPPQQQADFDIVIPQNEIFDQSLLQKLIDKSVLITPVNSGASSSTSFTSTYSNDVSSTIKSPKDDHIDSSFVCKADSTNPVAKAKRSYTRKRPTKRPPKIDVSLQHKLPNRPVNHLEPVCLPSSSSASPKSETKPHQPLFGHFANPPQRQQAGHQTAPVAQHAGTAIVLSPVAHSKTSVKLVQYITNTANIVGSPKSFCTISNNLIGKQNFMMQPTSGPKNYTITTNNKTYAAHGQYEHDSNSSTSSSSSVSLEQHQQQQLHRINSSEHKQKPMVMPAQFFIINKKAAPTTTTSKSAPVPVMHSPPPATQPHSRKAIIHSVQVMNPPSGHTKFTTPQNLTVSLQSPVPKKRGRPKGSKNKVSTGVQLNKKSPTAAAPAILNKKKRAVKPKTLLALQQQQQHIQQANKLYNVKRKGHDTINFGVAEDEEANYSYINAMQHNAAATSTTTTGAQQFQEPPTIHQQLLTNRGHDLLSSVASAANNDEQLTPPEIMQPPMQQNLIIDYTTNLCHGGDTFIDSLNDIESASVHSYHDDDFVMIDNNR